MGDISRLINFPLLRIIIPLSALKIWSFFFVSCFFFLFCFVFKEGKGCVIKDFYILRPFMACMEKLRSCLEFLVSIRPTTDSRDDEAPSRRL